LWWRTLKKLLFLFFKEKEMINKTTIIRDLKKHLQEKLGDYIQDVILFGSQATGIAGEVSDFDILILVKTKPDWKLKSVISDYCYDIELKYDIITDTHILSEAELDSLRGKQPIFQNAIQKGIYA